MTVVDEVSLQGLHLLLPLVVSHRVATEPPEALDDQEEEENVSSDLTKTW